MRRQLLSGPRWSVGRVGEIVKTRNSKYSVGDFVLGYGGWQEYALSNGAGLRTLDPTGAKLVRGDSAAIMARFDAARPQRRFRWRSHPGLEGRAAPPQSDWRIPRQRRHPGFLDFQDDSVLPQGPADPPPAGS
jgi:hypothetical protein